MLSPLRGWGSLTMTFTGKFVYIYTPVPEFLLKVVSLQPITCKVIKKETPAQAFSFIFCETFKKILTTEHLRAVVFQSC